MLSLPALKKQEGHGTESKVFGSFFQKRTASFWSLVMIDDLVILFSTIACVVVVFRAIRLDGRLPWFGPGTEPPDAP